MDADKDIKILSELFNNKYKEAPENIKLLPGAGSGRRYYRLISGANVCIGVAGENLRDCRAFISLSRDFRAAGINVPEIYDVDNSGLYYIQEDLGDESLFAMITKVNGSRNVTQSSGNLESEVEVLIKDTLRQLARMQSVNEMVWGEDVEYKAFSYRQIYWDLNYFKYEYLRPLGVDFDEEALEDDFEQFAYYLSSASKRAYGFMYRDFQSRNVMVKDGKCWFIDFQGGRKGPSLYDAVSFLWQAKASFTPGFRREMLKVYADEYYLFNGIKPDKLLASVNLFVLFRTLQVLGAYGLRGIIERKAHFIESIPPALRNLKELISSGVLDEYPELKRISEKITSDARFNSKEGKDGKLEIEVYSFSYKKGYPANYTGNGGGFMFDCRGMHNPGRYAEFKTLTGMDAPVIEFLKEKGETDLFSDRAVELISPTVERYIRRGFTNLQIGFGCTGGQHRSVYCAERVAKILAAKFPEAKIILIHREQNIRKVL